MRLTRCSGPSTYQKIMDAIGKRELLRGRLAAVLAIGLLVAGYEAFGAQFVHLAFASLLGRG